MVSDSGLPNGIKTQIYSEICCTFGNTAHLCGLEGVHGEQEVVLAPRVGNFLPHYCSTFALNDTDCHFSPINKLVLEGLGFQNPLQEFMHLKQFC